MVLLFIWFEDTSKEAGFIFMIRFLQEALDTFLFIYEALSKLGGFKRATLDVFAVFLLHYTTFA